VGFGLFLAAVLFLIMLAFSGAFGKFPDDWAWIGIVLAGIGIVITAPTIFQMIWGRPRVDVTFETVVESDASSLQVFFSNPPVMNKVLRFISVRREAVQSLAVQFRIAEAGSGTIIIPIHQAPLYTDDSDMENASCRSRIPLPTTYSVGATAMIALWDAQNKCVIIPPDRLRQPIRLKPGYYQAQILLLIDGLPRQTLRRFVVGAKAGDLVWSSPNNK
jgi:hypothetical protein